MILNFIIFSQFKNCILGPILTSAFSPSPLPAYQTDTATPKYVNRIKNKLYFNINSLQDISINLRKLPFLFCLFLGKFLLNKPVTYLRHVVKIRNCCLREIKTFLRLTILKKFTFYFKQSHPSEIRSSILD